MTRFHVGQRVKHRVWGLGTIFDPTLFPPIGSGEIIVQFDEETDYGDIVTVTESMCDPA
jgi:hypothetical protein